MWILHSAIESQILDQKPLSLQVYEELRDRIVRGRLQPGDRLNEARLAQDMGLSRAPVREAVQRLRQEGLVTIKPRHGPIVAEITAADATHLYQVRCALEELAVILLLNREPSPGLEALDEAVSAMQRASLANDLEQVVEQDVRFHEALCDLSGNPLLVRIYQTISAQFRIAVMQDDARANRLPEIAADHAQLLEAIRQRNIASATPNLREHILSSLPTLVARLDAQTVKRTR